MAKVETRNTIRTYPDGDAVSMVVTVRNHWNWGDRVVLEIDGREYVVIAEHLRRAIQNATNAH